MIAFSKLKTPSTAIPMSLNGNRSNHITGNNINAKRASGQHKIKSNIHKRNVSID
ncbi:hypothetical protein [Hanamia caeni]|uniref:hypothetical protein n=1 Tax=Hanamia caeni TaxID=2294116 RepID=UPI001314A28E|nr:hypothetical protein [Hanamia caeni]